MDDELRKAAQALIADWDDDVNMNRLLNRVEHMRNVLAKNANAAPHARDAVTWTPETGYVFADAKNANAAPQDQDEKDAAMKEKP